LEVEETIAINYIGAVNVARASHKYLATTQGHLLLFTSSSHTRGRADYSIYSSTKAAVVNLGQALADEWSSDGVCVNVVNPERTSTPMRTKAFGDEDPATLLTSEAVAQSCVDVLSTRTTGHVIDVRVASS
jgi:2-C-methyl-D-erythritol 4-phosphate cytidylyltransferase